MDPTRESVQEAFLQKYSANEAAIRAFVRRLVPTRQDASDVMQDVVLVLWRKFPELDDPANFRRWAFGVARFEALGWARDKARDRVVLSDDVLSVIADESDRLEGRLSAQRQALEGCIQKLPDEDRELVLSSYEAGSRVHEIAARSGRTVAAFYQWLHRTRLRLLECTHRVLQSEGGT